MPLFQGRVLASGIMVPINVDADGDLQIDVKGSLPAGSALIGDIQARNLGWISAAWRKDPLRVGYSGQVLQKTTNTTLAAGTNTLDTGAVPANRVWIITQITIQYVGTIGGVNLYVDHRTSGGAAYGVFSVLTVVSTAFYDRQGYWVLASGDYVRLTVVGATLNDDAFVVATGFYFDTAQ